MKPEINPRTNNPFVRFVASLVNISPTVNKNKNDTMYRVVTVKLTDSKGRSKNVTGFMYESNYELGKGYLKPGDVLLARAEKTPQRDEPIIIVSHLVAGERLNNSAIDWVTGDINFFPEGDEVVAKPAAPGFVSIEEVESVAK